MNRLPSRHAGLRIVVALGMTTVWLGVLAAAGPPATARTDAFSGTSCTVDDPFTDSLAAQLAARWPGQRFSAAVYDPRSGCQYVLNPELSITTASVVKMELMAGVLLRAQAEGRGLTSFEQSRIEPMITQSADAPATDLWNYLGGTAGMAAVNQQIGLTQTSAAPPTWGLTSTTARDQVYFLRQLLLGQFGPFTATSRAIARQYMTSVVPEQRWGITAGVPGGWTVAQKNGFADSGCCGWRINSVGVVTQPSGRDAYAVAILTDGWPSEDAGIAGNELVARAVSASLAHVPTGPGLYQSNSLNGGTADNAFTFGAEGDQVVVGDWNGDGIDTPAVFRNGTWYLRNSNSTGSGEMTFTYGQPGDLAVAGDWNGDNVDGPGVYRNGTFYLRNSNSTGAADQTAGYGQSGDIPVVGDWNGDAVDTIGVYRNGTFYLRSSNSTGIADKVVPFGLASDRAPATGDWDGDGIDTAGLYRGGLFYLTNTSDGGSAQAVVPFGLATDRPLPGDWSNQHSDTPGLLRNRL